MPYKVQKVKGGYKVSDGKRFFSNEPLSKEMATRQRLAITIPLAKKMGKEPGFYFA